MPKEIIKYGRDYATVTVHGTKETGGYSYELGAEEAHKGIAGGGLARPDVEFSNKPAIHLHWQRPIDRMSLPAGEEPKGSVQLSLSLNPTDTQRLITHIAEHPEDLEPFSTFYTEPLTRHEINEAIRNLKRARDAAYGADE